MSETKSKKRVGIIRGGAGEHYTSSLKKGGDIISHIVENLREKYKVLDILIDKDHIWHASGVPISAGDLVNKVDVVWNASHPSFSNIIESLSIPHIGAGPFLGSSRDILRKHIKEIGVDMPRHIIFPKSAREVFNKFGAPWIVRDKLVITFPELVEVIEKDQNVLVEEFIAGKVASLHSVPNFRGEDFYVFPPVNVFGELSAPEKENLAILARKLHNHLGAKHYLRLNFVLNKRGKVYLLDFDSAPNLNSFSHFSQACDSVGAKMHHVVEHILENV